MHRNVSTAKQMDCFAIFAVLREFLRMLYAFDSSRNCVVFAYPNICKRTIIFADLEMPDVDGLHLAAELRKEDQHTLLIFVTNHDELVFQCFQYEVFNFIRKDFLESELPLAAASAYQKVWNHTSKLQLKSKTGLLSLAADDVVYFVSENHTIMMCEKENTKVQVMYTMEKLEKLLPQNQFVRCHAGYIVNCFYVFSINPNEILLTTGERIPLSRHRKKEMKSVFQQYLRGI